jgi:hypothetical protein
LATVAAVEGSRARGSGRGAKARAVMGEGVWSKKRIRWRGRVGACVGAGMLGKWCVEHAVLVLLDA